ncbi:solute carrier family 24 member Nckx30C isoform X3 [Haematobia irritans]|uniref:solute carrier family 24 member Nckx30C isoform X3 n=1 Tax=Haematobia irritans TaxID=7368 RepID=UPI003F50D1B3
MLQQPKATCFQPIKPQILAKNLDISLEKHNEIFKTPNQISQNLHDFQRITLSPYENSPKGIKKDILGHHHRRHHHHQRQQSQSNYVAKIVDEKMLPAFAALARKILPFCQGYGPNAQTTPQGFSTIKAAALVKAQNEANVKTDFPTLLEKMKAQIFKRNNPSLLNDIEPGQKQEMPTNKMLPLPMHYFPFGQQQDPQGKSNIKAIFKPIKESLDFNSRRRRGRLRSTEATEEDNETVSAYFSDRQTEEMTLAAARSYVPATFVYLNIVAKQLRNLLLTLLLSFLSLITFVNKIPKEKLELPLFSWLLTSASSSSSSSANKRNFQENSHKLVASQKSGKPWRTKSSSSSLSSASSSWLSSSSLFSSISLSTSISSNLISMRLLYAFLFVSILLIIPSNDHHMVSAAKPKSATQLHQQQQQQQQQEQHHHKPNVVYAAGADNVHIDEVEGMVLTPPSYPGVSSQTSKEDETEYLTDSEEQLFDDEKQNMNIVEEEGDDEEDMDRGSYEKEGNGTHKNETIKTPLFPTDLFTKEQLENGAVICHIIGVIYMFVALAIVCDEFFVPSLDVIIEKLGITDDVAGATFMAAGGSAPELFTSVIGVFVSFDDVGIGTIVGSAVFNILFVIGMCALFSRTVLSLTWWPLFRDCTFYSVSLLVLIYFFRDNRIWWWEALILFSIYIAYVGFMKWNVQVESCVKKLITKNKGNAANSSETSMATQPGGSVTSRAASETRSGPPGSSSGAGTTGNSSGGNANTTQTGAKFRHGLLQLMIHTIDPLHDDDVPGKVDEKATQLHAIASLKVLLDATKPQRGGATTSAANHVKINLKETTLADRPNGNIDTTLDSPSLSGRRASWIDQRVKIQTRKFSIKQTQEIEDEPEPLNMSWPDTARKRLTYILVAPLLIPMWLTLPDTRTPKGKKLFPITFIGSILWIAAFSYLMVWWANVAGDTARIPPEVMGLTFLAAGTSIPDLITSVIVARKGFGDMAVSSSVGSNIFDVTVGLPIPWLLYGIIYDAPVEVNSVGMVCSITILFMMLLFVVMSIACFRWRMNKGLGFTMFLLYFVFVAVSLMFEYDVITCPV